MGDYLPNHLPGNDVAYTAGATITGGQVVYLSGTPRVVSPTTAAVRNVVGIACHDAILNQPVTVSRGGEQRPVANGAITAGVLVKSAAAGQVSAFVAGTDAIDLILGTALFTVADQASVDIAWRA